MKFKHLFFILLLLSASPSFGKEKFTYEAYTLENGLQVILIPNNRAPVAYHALWYKVGSADSPMDKTGLAHFLEHLMFKGSLKFPGDKFKRTINDLGGDQNANTTWDRTGYFITIAKEHLPLVMEMEADRMQNLLINPADVEKEKEVVLQERRSVIDSKPEACLGEAANASFFWQHPYGKPVIGFEEHIRNYTREDAIHFYKTWYNPNNAILVIAGDIDIPSLKSSIQKQYGSINPPPVKERNRTQEPTHRQTKAKVELRDPQIGSILVQRLYRAPNYRTGGIKKEAALSLLKDILGDQTDGRLNATLVEKQKLAHFAVTNYIGYFYDPYSFTITASPINPSELDLLDASIEAQIRHLLSEGITEQELQIAKNLWLIDARFRHDSLHGIADYFGENLSLGYSLNDITAWPQVMAEITTKDITEAAKEILESGPEVTMIAYPLANK